MNNNTNRNRSKNNTLRNINAILNKNQHEVVLTQRLLEKVSTINGGTEYEHKIGKDWTFTTSAKYWHKLIPFGTYSPEDRADMITIGVNAMTMVITLLFILPWLHEFKRLSQTNTIAWLDYFNQGWIPILHYILEQVFSNEELAFISGAFEPYKLLLAMGSFNSDTLRVMRKAHNVTNICVRQVTNIKSAFNRSMLNLVVILGLITISIKGAVYAIPANKRPHTSRMQNLRNYQLRSFNNRSLDSMDGVVSMIQSTFFGMNTPGNRASKAAHSFAEELLPFFGTLWWIAGGKIIYKGTCIGCRKMFSSSSTKQNKSTIK